MNIAQNQVSGKVVAAENDALRVHSIWHVHRGCNYAGYTFVERKCSCLAVCCLFLGWMTVCQMCKGKDLTCCDAEHSCANCGGKIGTYNAC
jgi:hypothetical protein